MLSRASRSLLAGIAIAASARCSFIARFAPRTVAVMRRSSSALALAALAASACAPAQAATLPTEVGIRIHYSRFDAGADRGPGGVPITFTLVNDDPIEHEWLIGDSAFHNRHRTGTEPVHGDVPTRSRSRRWTTKTTTLTFAAGNLHVHLPLPGARGVRDGRSARR